MNQVQQATIAEDDNNKLGGFTSLRGENTFNLK